MHTTTRSPALPLLVALLAASPAWAANQTPIADAGPDRIAGTSAHVVLDATRSHDRDGLLEAYQWRQTQGARVKLEGADTSAPGFTSPSTLKGDTETLVFRLTVTDDQKATASDTVSVRLSRAPVCPAPQRLVDGMCATVARFNDTGLNRCADTAVYDLACPLAFLPGQDGDFGRDVRFPDDTDGKAGFSFTKIGANGVKLSAQATEWSCVQDNVTGLIWEAKTADGGSRDMDRLYTQYSPAHDPKGEYGGPGDANSLLRFVNAQGLCGAKDWRLPGLTELQGLVDYGVALPGPAIDLAYFPHTRSDAYWTGSTDGRDTKSAWAVYFNGGEVYNPDRDQRFAVRLVRGKVNPNRFVVARNGLEVSDQSTGLIWRRCAEGMEWDGTTCTGAPKFFMWYEALHYTAPGRTGWRLPNVKELASLVNVKSQGLIRIDTKAFPGTTNDQFWTASPWANDAFYGWVVQSFYGWSYFTYLEDLNAIRLVRDLP